jgi:2,3-bisphosphoglycerate-dependent phosphoglycerate mutase
MATLVMLRHGQSTWNAENLFTGWTDVDLTEQGEAEAVEAGRLLASEGLTVDVVHTSVLLRSIRTANLTLAELDRLWLPQRRHWRLNERHYGDLQGRNKAETAARYGSEKVLLWRRSYDVPPPPLAEEDERHPGHDPRYDHLAPDVLPATECLADVVARMLPYWHDAVVPDLVDGRTVLLSAHGNSLRALVKHLDRVPEAEITGLNIPTGFPLVYELDHRLRPVSSRYLGDPEVIAAAIAEVAGQAGPTPGTGADGRGPDDPRP